MTNDQKAEACAAAFKPLADAARDMAAQVPAKWKCEPGIPYKTVSNGLVVFSGGPEVPDDYEDKAYHDAAQFIVLACNAHHDLLAVCDLAVERINNCLAAFKGDDIVDVATVLAQLCAEISSTLEKAGAQ